MRKKLNETEKKVTVTLTINPVLMNRVNELYNNKSKYIEKLIYNDLLKNKFIEKDVIL